jgi:hypothetical protein
LPLLILPNPGRNEATASGEYEHAKQRNEIARRRVVGWNGHLPGSAKEKKKKKQRAAEEDDCP